MLSRILDWDNRAWQAIHVNGQNKIIDTIAPIIRTPSTWIPLYVFLLIFIPYQFGKRGIYWCLSFVLTFGVGDYTSASIIKPWIQRTRPCNDPALQDMIHRLVDCGSGFSFPSAHATNHFSLATFMFFTLGNHYQWIKLPVYLWAFSIAYAQVYVGVHYPLDVICGGVLGMFIGFLIAYSFNRLPSTRLIFVEKKK